MALDLAAMDAEATRLLGTKFLHRGRDPATGLDCTGLVIILYRAGGFDFPDYVGELQAERDDPVDALAILARYDAVLDRIEGPPAPGDLLVLSFYSSHASDHVGILLGKVVHAARATGVTRSPLSRLRPKIVCVLRPRLSAA